LCFADKKIVSLQPSIIWKTKDYLKNKNNIYQREKIKKGYEKNHSDGSHADGMLGNGILPEADGCRKSRTPPTGGGHRG
jgi:hypothetical protein